MPLPEPPYRLIQRLTELSDAIVGVRLKLTEPKLGNPKYAMDRSALTSELDSLQNQKIVLLATYVDFLTGDPLFALEGNWVIELTHVGPTPAQTAHAKTAISPQSASQMAPDVFWSVVEYEVERLVRSVDRLEGKEERPRRRRSSDPSPDSLMQDDMAILLRALGLGDHPRPISPHEVMVGTIIPAVDALVKIVDSINALNALKGLRG